MGTIKAVFGIAVVIALVFLGAELIPPYFTNYQFADTLNTTALTAMYSTKSDEDIRALVYKQAKDMDLPIAPEQIKVHRTGGIGTGTLVIEADYIVHVELPGYPLDLNFHAATKNKSIY